MSTDEDDIRLKLAVEAFHHLGAAINVSVEKIAKQLPDMESTNRQAILVALLDLVAQAKKRMPFCGVEKMDEGIDLSEAKRALDQFKVSRPGGGGKPPGPLDTRDADDDNEPMDARLTKLESIIPTLATKADVEGVRTDIQRGINETHRWMLGTVIGLFLGFGGLFLAMSNSLKVTAAPAGASATPAPNIIINVPPSTALTAPAK